MFCNDTFNYLECIWKWTEYGTFRIGNKAFTKKENSKGCNCPKHSSFILILKFTWMNKKPYKYWIILARINTTNCLMTFFTTRQDINCSQINSSALSHLLVKKRNIFLYMIVSNLWIIIKYSLKLLFFAGILMQITVSIDFMNMSIDVSLSRFPFNYHCLFLFTYFIYVLCKEQ